MFSARSAAIAADYPRPGPATGKNAAVETFIQYAAFKAARSLVRHLRPTALVPHLRPTALVRHSWPRAGERPRR